MQEQTTHTPEIVYTPLPRDPNRAIEEMIITIDRLRGIYERETHALEEVDAQGFMAEQEEKFLIATLYQNRMQEAMQRKLELRTANPELKSRLERMQSEFSELTFRNMKALKKMQKTMDRLSNTIRRVAREETKKQRTFSYGANGTLNDDSKKRISMSVSETA